MLYGQKVTQPSLILGRPADVLSPPPSPFSVAIFQGSLYMSGGRVRIFRPATAPTPLWTAPSFCSRLAAAAAFRLSAKTFRFCFRISAKAFCFSALAFRFSAAASRFAAATAFIIFLRVETEGFLPGGKQHGWVGICQVSHFSHLGFSFLLRFLFFFRPRVGRRTRHSQEGVYNMYLQYLKGSVPDP